MTTIPTLFVYFLYDHIPTFFYIFKKCFLLLVYIIIYMYMQCTLLYMARLSNLTHAVTIVTIVLVWIANS